MKAYYSKAYGDSGVSVFGELPDPVAGPRHVLVEIKAVSINPVDWKIRRGDAKGVTGYRFPRIFGADFAGIVRETGPEATAFSKGQRVYGSQSIILDRWGSLAELRAVKESKVRLIPEGMSFNEAASLPIAALTALNGLRRCGVTKVPEVNGNDGTEVPGRSEVPVNDRTGAPAGSNTEVPVNGGTGAPAGSNTEVPVNGGAGARAGSRVEVLVNGGTGGVGHFAIQIARARGATVIATCSVANAELAMQLGADETIDHSTGELFTSGRKYDAIIDAHGHMKPWTVHRLLKKNGSYASTLFIPPPYLAMAMTRLLHGKRLLSANMRSHEEDWQELERLYTEGSLRPVIENTFPLERASEAFDLAMRGGFRGKIIVTV
jgi:NADPH:quinone reductase-like Zn-dependent oxidoreductase